MNVIKDFLLQLALIAVPIFIYQTFFAERLKNERDKQLVISVIWTISIILCMSFPAKHDLINLDIRIVPLLLGSLYSGFGMAIILSVVIILYRLCVGIDIGIYNTVFVLLTAVPVILYFRKFFETGKKYNKANVAALLSFFYWLVGIFWTSILRGILEVLVIQVIYLIFVVIATWCLTMLNENIRETRQLRLEVHKTEKLRVIGDLTSVFAHEIRNPLQVARGFLQILRDTNSPDKKEEYIQVSIEELDRANAIVNDLLAFGKPATEDNQKIDAGYQLRRAINILETYSLSKNVTIQEEICDKSWIYANAQKIHQCFINILKNAIESMPEGGTVWVTCKPTEDYIEISIKDEGIGMTSEQIERLGSPYYSLKESGTGLGMMVSFQIIQSFKGKVVVTSKQDVGTKFSVLLPMIK
jgi:two-component system sporulation sensor kinase B